jgi:glycosyltransferase involved in cell wall biosynthesis
MLKSKKVLFIHNTNASWIDRDLTIIGSKYQVYRIFIASMVDLINLKTYYNVYKSDVIYLWFGSLYFFPIVIFSKLFCKKIIVVSGGYDVAKVQSINYGAFLSNPLINKIRVYLFNTASKVICISNVNLDDTKANIGLKSEKYELILHGFSKPCRELMSRENRKNQVVFLSRLTKQTYNLKGINFLFEIAKELPEYEFVVLGKTDEYVNNKFREWNLKNLKALGFLDFGSDKFLNVLNDSKIVLMLSAYESFGCALVDGAIMGCYPISFDQFGQKEVNEGVGTICKYGDVQSVVDEIRRVSDIYSPDDVSNKMLIKYPYSIRKKRILDLIEKI